MIFLIPIHFWVGCSFSYLISFNTCINHYTQDRKLFPQKKIWKENDVHCVYMLTSIWFILMSHYAGCHLHHASWTWFLIITFFPSQPQFSFEPGLFASWFFSSFITFCGKSPWLNEHFKLIILIWVSSCKNLTNMSELLMWLNVYI